MSDTMLHPDPGPAEPLASSAALAHEWAQQSCRHDEQGCSCSAYHGFWQVMRLLQLGATLGGHPEHYRAAMRRWAERPCAHGQARRVLISGCADYSMLAHLWHCIGPEDALEVTVLDICPTPLRLNEWYAQRLGRALQTVCSDILAYRPPTGFDLIVTSSFLGFFDPQQRPELFRRWRRLLRADGWLVSSNRLRAQPEHMAVGFTADQATQLADTVKQRRASLPASVALDTAQLDTLALAFAAQMRSYPVASTASIETLATDAGLRVVACDTLQSAPMARSISGPTLGDGSRYAFFVLQR